MKILFVFLLYAAVIFGECRCIYLFCTSDFKPPYKREIIYGVGIVAGYGVILGWLPAIKDTPDTVQTTR